MAPQMVLATDPSWHIQMPLAGAVHHITEILSQKFHEIAEAWYSLRFIFVGALLSFDLEIRQARP
jgi:hypothetical protein